MSDEKPDFISILGMAIIASSLVALNLANRREQKLKTK
jgi:hypothetical protein